MAVELLFVLQELLLPELMSILGRLVGISAETNCSRLF